MAGQSVTVGFALAVQAPGAGTPSGNVTVSDGVDSCQALLPANSCEISINTAGARMLIVSYTGDANFNPSTTTATQNVTAGGTDLSVQISNNREFLPPSGTTSYTVLVENVGAVASNAQLDALVPAGLSGYRWTCAASAGSSCQSLSGTGSIVAGVNLAAGGSVSYQVQADVDAPEGTLVSNQASITPAIAPPDGNAQNDSSTDTDVVAPFADSFE